MILLLLLLITDSLNYAETEDAQITDWFYFFDRIVFWVGGAGGGGGGASVFDLPSCSLWGYLYACGWRWLSFSERASIVRDLECFWHS